ncbi:hypothetical protein N868_11215, partial [Cellulomonas carbonis T26]
EGVRAQEDERPDEGVRAQEDEHPDEGVRAQQDEVPSEDTQPVEPPPAAAAEAAPPGDERADVPDEAAARGPADVAAPVPTAPEPVVPDPLLSPVMPAQVPEEPEVDDVRWVGPPPDSAAGERPGPPRPSWPSPSARRDLEDTRPVPRLDADAPAAS